MQLVIMGLLVMLLNSLLIRMKKVINIGLIVFVLALWGTIVYRYVNNYFYPQSSIIEEDYNQYSLIKINKRDTFNLANLNRDPFLGKITIKYKAISINNNSTIKVSNKISKPISSKISTPIPTIQYFGIIKSSSKKDEMIIVKINNVVKKMRLNSEFEGVKVNKVFKDSILISFNKKQLFIKRN